MTITKGYLDTARVQVHVRTTPSRGGLPLVLLHQTASSSVMYEALMHRLADRFTCVAPDTPGFGGTDALDEPASIEGYAAVLREALAVAGIDRCWLFGHHTGASIAAQMAVDAPHLAARVVLSGPPLLTREQIERVLPTVSPVRLEPDGAHVMAVWERIRHKDPTAPVGLVHREAVLNLHAGVRYPEAYHAVFAHDLAGCLRRIEVPTLVMAGAQDTIRDSLEPAHALLRHGAIRALPRGTTYICDREPDLVAGALIEFFTPE